MPHEELLAGVEEQVHPEIYDKIVALTLLFKMYLSKNLEVGDFLRQIKQVADEIDLSKLPSSDGEAQFLKEMNPTTGEMATCLIRLANYYDSIGRFNMASDMDNILKYLSRTGSYHE